ncbi:hypothetical protein D9M68_856780 [compost metagenome]
MATMRHVANGSAVLAGQQIEIATAGHPFQRRTQQIGGSILDADHVAAIPCQTGKGVHGDVDDAARWYVVNDHRDGDRGIDGAEVLIKPFLRRLVIVGRDDKQRIGACRLRVP